MYEVQYRVILSRYPDNWIESTEPFTVTVEDPCDNPVSVTPSKLESQEYTITQDTVTF